MFTVKRSLQQAVIMLVMLTLCLSLNAPGARAAASSWDEGYRSIEAHHDIYTALEAANTSLKLDIKTLRKKNTSRLTAIQADLRSIDKAHLDQLKATLEAVRLKHAPILEEYSSWSKKLSEAKTRKDHKSALLYELRRNRIKTQVTSARQSIQKREQELGTARTQAAAKAKPAKDVLLGIPALKKQATACNKTVTSLHVSRAAAVKRYHAAVKQGDALAASTELATMIDILNQIKNVQHQTLHIEQSIEALLTSAEARLPK